MRIIINNQEMSEIERVFEFEWFGNGYIDICISIESLNHNEQESMIGLNEQVIMKPELEIENLGFESP